MAFDDPVEHFGFGELFGAGFDHQHGIFGTGNHQIEAASGHVSHEGIDDVAVFVEPHRHRTNWPRKGDVADGEGCRCRNNRQRTWVVDHVNRKGGDDDLDFVEVTFGEERAQRAIGQA